MMVSHDLIGKAHQQKQKEWFTGWKQGTQA